MYFLDVRGSVAVCRGGTFAAACPAIDGLVSGVIAQSGRTPGGAGERLVPRKEGPPRVPKAEP